MIGFFAWALVGVALIVLGIFTLFAKKAVGFWANIEISKVKDVKGYNHATGKLYIFYGAFFILLGLPILSDNNSLILLSIVGVVFETIIIMAVYSTVIVNKYSVNR